MRVPEEVLAKYYGCGSPLPAGIAGLRVLDLGKLGWVMAGVGIDNGHVGGGVRTKRGARSWRR